MTKKLPSMQFYPGDWRKDPGVQALDFESRGIWFEILSLRFGTRYMGEYSLSLVGALAEARLVVNDKFFINFCGSFI